MVGDLVGSPHPFLHRQPIPNCGEMGRAKTQDLPGGLSSRRVVHGFRDFHNYCIRMVLKTTTAWQTPPTPTLRAGNAESNPAAPPSSRRAGHLDSDDPRCV